MQIAFIGLGKMGAGMARNLLRAGHRVSVYNRTLAKAEALANDGAQPLGSIAAACQGCDAAMTMLADDAALEQTVFGESALAASLPKGAAHISCSTISTAMARRLAAEHSKRGQGFLSAPVFGRPEAAEAKKLLVAVGGDPSTRDRFRPLFDAIGRRVFVAGNEPWQANALKLCGNFMIASMLEAFSEAFANLRKSGVDPKVFLDAMIELFGSPVYANYGALIAEERFEPAGFTVPLGLKDVRLILESAQESAAPMPMASLIRDQLLAAVAAGQEHLDWSSIARIAARNAGLTNTGQTR
jgi:3-hydroxyisobutyrate dehydrogenase-like beta-hydroxyacid dehydrogenase